MTCTEGNNLIVLVPGLALPKSMDFLLEYCRPTRHTLEAIRAGHLLKINYHPPYLQLECNEVEKIVREARRRSLRVYYGKKHITITDGIYGVKIYFTGTPENNMD